MAPAYRISRTRRHGLPSVVWLVVDEDGIVSAHDILAHELLGPRLAAAPLRAVLEELGTPSPTIEALLTTVRESIAHGRAAQVTLPILPVRPRGYRHYVVTVIPAQGSASLALTETAAGERRPQLLQRRFAYPGTSAGKETETRWWFAVLDQVPIGITVFDSSGEVAFVNKRGRQLMSLPVDGRPLQRPLFASVADPDGLILPESRLPSTRARNGETVPEETLLLTALDGKQVPLRSSATRITTALGVAYVIVTYRDISRDKAIARLRDDYISALSHDLRSPLTVVAAAARLIEGSDDIGFSKRMARQISEAAGSMQQMINQLMRAAKLESGQYQPQLAPVELSKLVRCYAARAQTASVDRIRLDPGPEPVMTNVDSSAVEQVIDNLVSNAIKYSPAESAVTLGWRATPEQVELFVLDSGPGVPPNEVERVFDRFYRSSRGASAHQGLGLGLGLYISRLLVEAHGGKLWAENRLEGGAKFSVALPLCDPTALAGGTEN